MLPDVRCYRTYEWSSKARVRAARVVKKQAWVLAGPEQPSEADKVLLLAEAYVRHGAAVYGLARQIAGTAAAEKVTVETFVALWGAPHSLHARAPSLGASLVGFAHRQAVHVLRSDSERHCQLATMGTGELEQEARERAGARAWDLLLALSADERRSVALAYFLGLRHREISAVLGRPEDAVKADLRAALSRLREQTERVRHPISLGEPGATA
jgi:RNA polymerase sigma factor (sigma-70 family)